MKIKDLEKREDYTDLLEYAHRMVEAWEEYSYFKQQLQEVIGYADKPMPIARRMEKIYLRNGDGK